MIGKLAGQSRYRRVALPDVSVDLVAEDEAKEPGITVVEVEVEVEEVDGEEVDEEGAIMIVLEEDDDDDSVLVNSLLGNWFSPVPYSNEILMRSSTV